jgi:exodeoxyribonuclease VII small subunit
MAEGPKIANDLDGLPYERLVAELDGVVKKLEAGELSLEESLAAFERGVLLAQAAEGRLDAAEQRVEVLLHGDRTAPLGGEASGVAEAEADDEVPF